MRATVRQQGRFAALSGLRKVPGPPESCYPVIIVDERGLPVFFLCEWYRRRKADDRGRTPDTYLDMLLPFAGFLLRHHYAWDAEPVLVHGYLVEFLRDDVGCHVRPDQEGEGYLVETTGRSPLSKSSLGVLLAALSSLYQVLFAAGYYRYPNPLRSEHLQALKREHLRQVKNAGAPDHAGIRGETWAETRRHPTGFIRQYRGKVWEPQFAMEPEAVQERMREAVDWMIAHASTLRDQVVLRLLRTTGARLSEILSLTAGGYRGAGHGCQALIMNKGSQGREEKRIYFTDSIEEALIKYIRTERSKYDPRGYTRLDQLDAADSIFLTAAGTPYTRSAFYYHWYSLLKRAQSRFHLAFSPHDLRHLHVTRNIARIEQKAKGDQQLEAQLREGFWRLMGWSSAETMEIYIHVLKKRQALLEIVLAEDEAVSASISPNAFSVGVAQRDLSSPMQLSPQENNISFEKDDLSWYEE